MNVDVAIGQFVIDQTSPQLTLTIRVIEKDLVFNDVGSKQVKIKVDLRNTSPQTSTHEIPVKERRGFLPSNATAFFSVTIETRVSDMILYVAYEHGIGGWTNVLSEKNQEPIGLSAYLKVLLEKEDEKRQYFKIMEGILQGTRASVKFQSDDTSYLQAENPHTESAILFTLVPEKR